jgi:hypothetical protein
MIVRFYPRNLGLLEHELRYDDVIRITGASPGKVSAVAAKPPDDPSSKSRRVS